MVPENIHASPKGTIGNSKGEGVYKALLKEIMNQNWIFQRVGVDNPQKPSIGEGIIFSETRSMDEISQ